MWKLKMSVFSRCIDQWWSNRSRKNHHCPPTFALTPGSDSSETGKYRAVGWTFSLPSQHWASCGRVCHWFGPQAGEPKNAGLWVQKGWKTIWNVSPFHTSEVHWSSFVTFFSCFILTLLCVESMSLSWFLRTLGALFSRACFSLCKGRGNS